MKLTKRDIAEGLGLVYNDEEYSEKDDLYYHVFSFGKKTIYIHGRRELDDAWEEAAEKLLDPLVDYLLGNLDD